MNSHRNSVIARFAAAAASTLVTFVLFSGVVSLSEPRADTAALKMASVAAPR